MNGIIFLKISKTFVQLGRVNLRKNDHVVTAMIEILLLN